MALSAVMVIAATGCGKENKGKDVTTSGQENNGKEKTTNSDALIGQWINYSAVKAGVDTWTLQFNKDGSGVESFSSGAPDRSFTWTLKGSALTWVMKGENVLATFDGEAIVVNLDAHYCYLFLKKGDEGLGEEANRKNLIGSWIGSVHDDESGATGMFTYVFGEDGKGTYTEETSYDDGRPSETESTPFTWTLTSVKLELKYSEHDYEATCYNGKNELYHRGLRFTKK